MGAADVRGPQAHPDCADALARMLRALFARRAMGVVRLVGDRAPRGLRSGVSGTTGRIRVSGDGGGLPSWSADGHELLYATYRGETVAVTVTPDGRSLRFGQPRVLFRQFAAASPDGKRFLTSVPLAPESPITVLLNWKGR